MMSKFCKIRFRCNDGLHSKGDIQYLQQDSLYVGQTPACELKIPSHPDYEDTCYAVITRKRDMDEWHIIRQERDAMIRVNGIPLDWVHKLNSHDRLSFDHTDVEFIVKEGEVPAELYSQYKSPKWIIASLATIFVLLFGIIFSLHQRGKDNLALFKEEIESIYKIESDTLLVLSANDTLSVVSSDQTYVGTGFVTSDGYFVTARHCVEFWLGLEHELRPNLEDIQSEIVKHIIASELDSTLRVVSKVRIISRDGKCLGYYTSDDFKMDKSQDNFYEFGDSQSQYIWRSIVSLYERTNAELGDVAVMKWYGAKSMIDLDEPAKMYDTTIELCSFGYPQSENKYEAKFANSDGKVYQKMDTPDECFICNTSLDQGFSGGPIFDKQAKKVIGLVSRSSDKHTLIVPVSRIYQLIEEIE